MNLKKTFKFIFNKIRAIIEDFLDNHIVRISFLIAALILMICFLKFSWSELENKYENRYQSNFQLDFNTENEIVENIKENKSVDLKKIIDID
ncbi:hypothetical protein LWE90_19000, partial [Clostridioides difficile]